MQNRMYRNAARKASQTPVMVLCEDHAPCDVGSYESHVHNLMRCADLCPSHCEEVPRTGLGAMSGSCTNKRHFRLLLETKSTFHPRTSDRTDLA